MLDTAERINKEVWEDIETTFPEFRLPTSQQASRDARLAFYTNGRVDPATGQTYGGTDPIDYPFLRDRQYLKKLKDGVYPALRSPFWLDLVNMPPVFTFVQRDFLRLTNFISASET